MTASARIAVVGAGLAGLAAARRLADAGCTPTVFEKSRGVGGRLSWRRTDAASFDHGAQFVTAKNDAFAGYLDAAGRAGAAARWPALEAERGDGRPAWVGAPGMSRLVTPLAEGLNVVCGVRVGAVARDGAAWRPTSEDGAALGAFDALLLAIPSPQAQALLADHAFADRLAAARYAPCWTGLFAFADRLPRPDVSRAKDGPLSAVARDASKPGRPPGETFVVHAGPEWSQRNLERSADDVASDLVAALLESAGVATERAVPTYAAAHRWRYARVEQALEAPCLIDDGARLAVAGDFCLGPRAEAAFESGEAAAAALIRALA